MEGEREGSCNDDKCRRGEGMALKGTVDSIKQPLRYAIHPQGTALYRGSAALSDIGWGYGYG